MEEKGFVGKHYLMKQAFGQEELHKREAVCTREDLPACMDTCPLEIDMAVSVPMWQREILQRQRE